VAHRAGEFLLRGLEKVDLEWRRPGMAACALRVHLQRRKIGIAKDGRPGA